MAGHYYGVTRSDEYLAHYGVKGMKWGVRKAIEKGDSKALARHYKKAAKKLAKLKRNENIDEQKRRLEKSKKVAKIGLGVGVAATTAATGSHFLNKALNKAWDQNARDMSDLKYAHRQEQRNIDNQIYNVAKDRKAAKEAGNTVSQNQLNREYDALRKARQDSNAAYEKEHGELQKKYDSNTKNAERAELLRNIIGGIGATGLATAAIAGGKTALHKYRTTAKGHAKAVEKRKDWEKEMRQTFKGTKYASLPVPKKSANKEKWKKNLQQDLRDAAASALVGPFLVSSHRAVVGDGNRLSDGKPYGSKKKRKG